MVVIRTDPQVIEEGGHLVTVATQAFDEAFGVGVNPRDGNEPIQAPMQFSLAPFVAQRIEGVPQLAQAHGILEQACQFFTEASPRAGGGELVDLEQFGEQDAEAL